MKKFFFVSILVLSCRFVYGQNSDSLSVEQLLTKGRYTKVVDLLSAKDTLSDKEHYQLGTAFLNLMKYRKALIHFSKAVRSDAQNTDYLFMLANVDELMGRPILAKYFYDRVLKIDSTFYMAKLKLANVLMDIKNYIKAAKLYGELAEKDSLNDYLIRRLSICKIKNRDTTTALNLLNRIYKAGTYNSKSALLLAKIYFSKEEYDSAITVMNAALKRDKMDMELNRFAAEVYFKLKRYRSAITKYLQSVTFGDSTAEVYQKLGLSYYSLANAGSLKKGESSEKFLENAFETLTISVELDGKNPITAMYLGLIYKDRKDYKSAIKYFEKALNLIYPSYLDVLYINLGASYDLAGNLKNAIEAYREARKYAPDKPELLFYLASAYDRFYKDKNVAIKYYRKFLSEQKDSDIKLVNYAKDRIERLKEIIHFSNHK